MGVWGDKVFDSDNSCDFLGNLVRQLEAVVDEGMELAVMERRRTFRATLAWGLYLSLDSPVVPAVAALRVLLARIPSARVCLPRAKVLRWQRAYWEWYEREYVPANGPNKRYRDNVQKEFDGLLRWAEGDDDEEAEAG